MLQELLNSPDPTIRYKTRVGVLGENPKSKKLVALRAEIADTPRVQALLSERNKKGEIPGSVYSKWDGAHWVLYALAELNYPPGDISLIPLREQQLDFVLSRQYAESMRLIRGVKRIHASIDANAIWSQHVLGIADERINQLVERLLETQWRDGGWNCDKEATGDTSSFMESLLPLRALVLHAQVTGDKRARVAVERCTEIFLARHLFKRLRDGKVMNPKFVQLHYPCYWHYDILHGLNAMRECGHLDDPRCADALDLLERKQLRVGGWAADARFYRTTRSQIPTGRSLADWGSTGTKVRNDFVTVQALAVLRAAGRYSVEK